jgi:hypothetical protein
MCLYTDDMLTFQTNIDVINEVMSFLSQNFDMKYLGEVNVILTIKMVTN